MKIRDYELIARVIKGRVDNINKLYALGFWSKKETDDAIAIILDLASFMSSALGEQDERFKYGRFIDECGLGEV